METIDFLTRSPNDADLRNELLRQNAKNVVDAYHNEWDILAELFQNAVDAIDQNDSAKTGVIDFVFNQANHKISIKDNGVGLSFDEVAEVLRPNMTFKRGQPGLRGEKGVGLSFILFSTNKLEFESIKNGERVRGMVSDASKWVLGETNSLPLLEVSTEPAPKEPSGTEFMITGVVTTEEESDLFSYGIGRLRHTILTKTAAGNTSWLFGKPPSKEISIRLTYVSENGKTTTEIVPYRYAAPHELILPSISQEERDKHLLNNEESRVAGKAVFGTHTGYSKSGRQIKVYYFITNRDRYSMLAASIDPDKAKVPVVKSGLYVATRSMPTGVEIKIPPHGKEGYWFNFYILLEYDDLRLDPGRKSVPPPVDRMLNKEAIKIYDRLRNHFTTILNPEDEVEESFGVTADLEEMWDGLLQNCEDLDFPSVSYAKVPEGGQGVVALFHELVGAGYLNHYFTWRSNSSRDVYDALVKYPVKSASRLAKVVVEFKYEAWDVIADIQKGMKEYGKIKLLVCWSVSSRKVNYQGFSIKKLDDDKEHVFQGATHELRIPGVTPITVISLKTLIARLKDTKGKAPA